MNPVTVQKNYIDAAAYLFAALVLLFVLSWKLLAALLAGLVVHELVHIAAPYLMRHMRIQRRSAKITVVALWTMVVIIVLTVFSMALVHYFHTGNENLPALLKKMAEILETSRNALPGWLAEKVPQDVTEIKKIVIEWLRTHAGEVTAVTKNTLRMFAHVLIGMILGAMIALHEIDRHDQPGPLASAMTDRAKNLSLSFRQVVFAQARIALLNTVFTAIYLAILLPVFGVKLPFLLTMIMLTFVFGLLPVIGNILSNTVIVIVSLSFSFQVAVISLLFLIVIHKVEYFLNAKIIGAQIKTKAWEILLAMLVLEVLFGIAGVIAAPIYYAYLKTELKQGGLV